MTHPNTPHTHNDGTLHTHATHPPAKPVQRLSVLAWPAWLRVLVVLPVVLALWLALVWANMGLASW
jgi:hypothetical protein